MTQSSGFLFGVRREDEVRVLAAGPHTSDDRPDGLAPVGIFICRARGEVFLTDDDLAIFEKHQGSLALVVAGGQAGFFVRELDGSVQAIRSHEEFRMVDAAPMPAATEAFAARELPVPVPRGWHCVRKRIVACALLLAIPAGALAYWRPNLPRPPIPIALRQEAGQLIMGWDPRALTVASRLEIRDGSERAILMLAANTSGATYGPQSGHVEVRLSTDTRAGGTRWVAPRFAPAPEITLSGSSLLQERIGELTLEAERLRGSLADRQARTKELAEKMEKLTLTPER